MWQRIQTLYLAIATALIISMFFTLKAVVPAADGTVAESYRFIAYTPYLILLIVITLLFFVLTNYKNLTALITLALQAWLVVDYLATSGSMAFRISAIFPLVAVIFDLMAARRIHADELMVESMSRLRSSKRRR